MPIQVPCGFHFFKNWIKYKSNSVNGRLFLSGSKFFYSRHTQGYNSIPITIDISIIRYCNVPKTKYLTVPPMQPDITAQLQGGTSLQHIQKQQQQPRFPLIKGMYPTIYFLARLCPAHISLVLQLYSREQILIVAQHPSIVQLWLHACISNLLISSK